MERRSLGNLSVTIVGIGCNNFGKRIDAKASARVIDAAIDIGINFFDTADSYGGGLSEEFIGKSLQHRRSEVILATKFGQPTERAEHLSRGNADWIKIAVDESLRRLGTDYIDYYQIHFPDPDVPIEETLGAMHELVLDGKVREIGCSNFGSQRLLEAHEIWNANSLSPFRAVQNRYSVLSRDPEERVMPACRELGIGLIPYYPLESGLLTGKYQNETDFPDGTRFAGLTGLERERFLRDGVFKRIEALSELAASENRTLLDLAMSWLVSNPTVTSVITGATRPEQVLANANATSWEMTPAMRAQINMV